MNSDKLPKDWVWIRLGDLGRIGSGGTPSRGKSEYWDSGTIPWVKISDITDKYINKTSERINEKGLENSAAKIFPKGTILISIFATLGDVGILNIDAACNQALAGIQLNNGNVNRDFLYYYLKTLKSYFESIGRGVAQNNINLTILKSTKIPLPPLPTQRRIVSILEKAEETKRLRAQADELTDRLLQSVFLEMFGDPVRNPKGWEIKKIGHIAEHVSSGSTPKGGQEVYQNEGILFIRSQNVYMNKLILDDIAFISEEIHNAMKRTWVKRGDVLINITGASIGRVAWYSGNDYSANVNQHVCIIRPKNDAVQAEFLSYQLSMPHYQKNIIAKQSGATRQAFNYSQIKDFDIIVPPLPLQQKFARVVEKIESMRQSQNQSKQQIEDLFSALMQKAFRGELVT